MTMITSALLLNRIPEIGAVRFRRLIEHFGAAEAVLKAPLSALLQVPGIGGATAQIIRKHAGDAAWAEQELKLAEGNGIQILTLEHPLYPERLRTLNDAPPILYCKGKLELLNADSIALVGTRDATPYGERMARTLAADLAQAGVATVSGLARGIDTFVHQSTLAAGGATVAVLGTGLLNVYPSQNRKLAQEIEQKGLMVSEFPLKMGPEPGNFPERNRIIAGLSLGTVVIEAGDKSGALITGRLATEQGREVFAVPGPATSKVSAGSNRLIKNGAKLTESAEDILEEISAFQEHLSTLRYNKERGGKSAVSLSKDESDVLKALCSDPVHIDRLSTQFKFSTGAFSKVLLDLELKGMIKALPGKMYARI